MIMICPIIVVAESASRILLTGGGSEFLIGCGNDIVYTRCPHDGYIEAIELTIESMNRIVAIKLIVLIFRHFGLAFVHLRI